MMGKVMMARVSGNLLPATGGQPLQLLAALLLLLCVGLGWQLWQQTTHTMTATARSAAAAPVRTSVDSVTDKAAMHAQAQAQAVVDTPWLDLFMALESIHNKDIYWLALTPNRKQQRIHMRWMSPRRASGWAYVQRLKGLPMLREVKLKSSATDNPVNIPNTAPMVVFEVEAIWQY